MTREYAEQRQAFRELHGDAFVDSVAPALYRLRYYLNGPGVTTPEPAEGCMQDRFRLQGLGAVGIVVEVVA